MIFEEQEIRTQIASEDPKAALMIEANKARAEGQSALNAFRGPLLVAVVGAVLAFIIEFVGSQFAFKNEMALERERAQASLVQSAFGTSPDETRANLRFLVRSGLVSEQTITLEKLDELLEKDSDVPIQPVSATSSPIGLPGSFLVILGSDPTERDARETVAAYFAEMDVFIVKRRSVYRVVHAASTASEAQNILDNLPDAVRKWKPYTVRRDTWCPDTKETDSENGVIECFAQS